MAQIIDKCGQMRDFREYLRAYRSYVVTHGWIRVLGFAVLWVAGMFLPAGLGTLLALPPWLAFGWMIVWALFGYFLAPYGMWKLQRAEIAKSGQPIR